MASEQLIKKTHEYDQAGEVRQVTHFESLTVIDSCSQPAVVHRVVETMHGAIGGVHDQSRTEKSATATARDVEQQIQSGDQARKNQFGPISTTTTKIGAHQTSLQPKKNNNYGGSKSAAMAKSSQQTDEQTKNQHVATTGLTDVGKKGATYVGEKAIETAEYARQAAFVTKDSALAAASGAAESMENLNAGVSGIIEDTAQVAEGTAIRLKDTVTDVGKKGAGYLGEKAIAGKDIALGTGKAAIGYVGKGAGVAKEGVIESMESLNAGVARAIEETAVAAELVTEKAMGLTDTAVDITLEIGKATARNVGTAAGAVKDATLVGGWTATEFASETASGVTESMENLNENLNAEVAELIEGTSLATEKFGQETIDTVVDVGKRGSSFVGHNVDVGKSITLETGKATTEYVGKATGAVKDATLVGGWTAVEMAAAGVTESMETLNDGVAGLLESSTLAAEDVARKTFNTMVDVGKKGATYIGEKVVAGKDITLETGKTTTEYVGKGASVVKDATLVGGWSALELASDTTKGVTESMENVNDGVAGLVENAAIVTEGAAEKATGLKDVAVDMCKRGASYVGEKGVEGKDTALNVGKTTTEYVGKVADVVKDATLVAGWSAAEVASGTAGGVTESIETLNAGVAGLVEGTALATESVAQKTIATMADMGKKGTGYVGGKAGALETGKPNDEYVGKASATLAAGRGATEFASDTAVESKENLTTKPKKIMVEREEITIDYGRTRKT